VPHQADRHAIRLVQRLHHEHERRAAAQAEEPRGLRGCHFLAGREEPAREGAVLAQQVLLDPRPAPHGIGDDVVMHEGAAALLHPHQTALRQRGDGAADGVAMRGEAAGQLRLARQARAGGEQAGGDLGLQRALDAPPQRLPARPTGILLRRIHPRPHRAARSRLQCPTDVCTC
jgi:hypothetical protein